MNFFFPDIDLNVINGRIRSIDAPVVPIHEAKTVPKVKIPVFIKGVALKLLSTYTPPEIVNKASNKN